jgi:hypothetical protein
MIFPDRTRPVVFTGLHQRPVNLCQTVNSVTGASGHWPSQSPVELAPLAYATERVRSHEGQRSVLHSEPCNLSDHFTLAPKC